MGVRADFYVGRGPAAEWLGSIAWDGSPSGLPASLFGAHDEHDFRSRVAAIRGEARDHFTSTGDGWPWPWKDSRTTDYAYAWDDGVWYTHFGHGWRNDDPPNDEDWPDGDAKIAFPDMSGIMNVTYGPRSGLLVFGVGNRKGRR